jgi:uncharacterized membrane protein
MNLETIQQRDQKNKYIKFFIIAQFLDMLSTFIGIEFMGFWEINPVMKNLSMFEMLVAKILGVAVVVCLLYYIKILPPWSYKLVFIISLFPPMWNFALIILELGFRGGLL